MKTSRLLASALLCLPLAAAAQAPLPPTAKVPPNHPPMGASPHAKAAPSPWAELADYAITVKVPPKGESGTWKIRTFADPADVLVDMDTPGPKGRTKGSVLLVGGAGLAAKGFTPERGFEVDSLDAAIVNLKVLTKLLDAVAPAGPASIKGRQAVSAAEAKAPIVAETPSANARFNAPWSIKGTVERVDAATVAFRLELETPGGEKAGERVRWQFSGTASGTPAGRNLDESMSLAGWSAYALGNSKPTKAQSHSVLRFRATALPGPYATVKDLRAALKQGQ
jgi:hypothetical protein